MTTHDLDRIRFVTSHLGDLQSSVSICLPLGVVSLFGGLASYFRSLSVVLLLLQAASLVGVFAIPRSRRYLEARFGKVEKKKGNASLWRVTIVFGGVLLIIILAAWANSVHGVSFFAVRMLYLLFGAVCLLRWIELEQRLAEAHQLALCALFLVIAARGAFPAMTPPEWLLSRTCMWNILWGSTLILWGLLDYWRLVRTFPPLAATAEEPEALAAEETR